MSVPRRAWRYGVIAALAFVLGSATIVTAETNGMPVGSLFFMPMVRGVPTAPCSTQTSDGKATTTCVAVVNAKGELATKDSDTSAALDRFQFGTDGRLKVATQGTSNVSGSVSVTGGNIDVGNFPATQQVAGSVNVNNFPATQSVSGSVSVSNLPATQPVSGSVNVSNFPSDQQIHGTVSISNLPAATAGGVTKIPLQMQNVDPGKYASWIVDVSSCRAFAVGIWSLRINSYPTIENIYATIDRDATAEFRLDVDLKTKNAADTAWAFPVQPWSTEPFYATEIRVLAKHANVIAAALGGEVFCQR